MIAAAAITVVIFIFLWNYLARRALTDAVEVSFRLSSEGAYADEELGFSEVIRNTGFLPVPAAEICFRIEKGISFREAENVTESDYLYKRDVFSMLGREQTGRVLDARERTDHEAVLHFVRQARPLSHIPGGGAEHGLSVPPRIRAAGQHG